MKMKFGNFTFPSNPSQLEIICSSDVSTDFVFGKSNKISYISTKPVIVKGSGEFFGEQAEENCCFLQHILRLKRSDILFLPSTNSITAYLTEFTYHKNSVKGSISYSFVFTEACSDKTEQRRFCYTTALEGENAFDIAGRCNVSVNEIMKNNDFKTPFDIKCGDRVVLR